MDLDTGTSQIRDWQSIVTLIVFVITNLIVLFPFDVPVYLPRRFVDAFLDALAGLRIISPRRSRPPRRLSVSEELDDDNGKVKRFVRFTVPMNFITAPLVADLFLLAILAIGRDEVYAGTLGTNDIYPLDIMIFFLTLAYIAISIDASGLIRYLAFKVLQWGGEVGHRLFLYLYIFFFGLASFIGNDPIILSGTAFLAYMTRVSSNIVHPRAWIHTQFAVANIGSAILVSSNPTNLVLAGAFNIKFIVYTANIIVPVLVTAIVLFPFLLYIVFANEDLIPLTIKMHELPEEVRLKKPVNPNIPNARGTAEEEENKRAKGDQGKLLSLEEIMNPFLDKGGAGFGAIVMAVTLVTVLGLNAASDVIGTHPVFYVTLPAAVVMLCWDLAFGWIHRHETREIARKGREEIELARMQRSIEEENAQRVALEQGQCDGSAAAQDGEVGVLGGQDTRHSDAPRSPSLALATATATDNDARVRPALAAGQSLPVRSQIAGGLQDGSAPPVVSGTEGTDVTQSGQQEGSSGRTPSEDAEEEKRAVASRRELATPEETQQRPDRATLASLCRDAYRWSQETFPTVTAVLAHLPFALVPFALSMFVLVQALVNKGWVPVFAFGWDHWVNKTGTLGAIGGMALISVLLCNFAGTNIGTTILLSRMVQLWVQIHDNNGVPISDRTFWATVYSMALGVNYGAFSTAFSASLAGLLWRDILARKHIRVRRLEFARVNLPIIAISMMVGCAVLTGEVYIKRGTGPFK